MMKKRIAGVGHRRCSCLSMPLAAEANRRAGKLLARGHRLVAAMVKKAAAKSP